MAEFMRQTDAFTWAMETDPRLRSTIVTVLMLERTPDWEQVRARFDLLSRALPMFRQRVVPSPPPSPPRWKYVRDFDLDYHMRRIALPGTATLDDVLELARIAQIEAFDQARPLWQVTLIDGLRGGGAAMMCKFHHALTDGVGGIEIGMTLFDTSESGGQSMELPAEPVAPEPGPLGAYGDAARYGAGLAGNLLVAAIKSAPGLLYDAVRRPLDTARSATEMVASVYRTVRPVSSTGSDLMKERSLTRHLSVLEVPMAGLRDAAHRHGGALNDAFVAGVAGGLRRYHEKHGISVDELHITMPISLRTDSDPMGGNRITLMRFDVPVGIADAAERIRQIHKRASRVRRERSLPFTQLIAGALNLMPRWYIGSILRHVDFVASDVPGVPIPVYLGGARVERQFAFGPTIGTAVNVTLLTYVDTCALGVDVDTGSIPDYDVFHECLVAGFDEVLALAG